MSEPADEACYVSLTFDNLIAETRTVLSWRIKPDQATALSAFFLTLGPAASRCVMPRSAVEASSATVIDFGGVYTESEQ